MDEVAPIDGAVVAHAFVQTTHIGKQLPKEGARKRVSQGDVDICSWEMVERRDEQIGIGKHQSAGEGGILVCERFFEGKEFRMGVKAGKKADTRFCWGALFVGETDLGVPAFGKVGKAMAGMVGVKGIQNQVGIRMDEHVGAVLPEAVDDVFDSAHHVRKATAKHRVFLWVEHGGQGRGVFGNTGKE